MQSLGLVLGLPSVGAVARAGGAAGVPRGGAIGTAGSAGAGGGATCGNGVLDPGEDCAHMTGHVPGDGGDESRHYESSTCGNRVIDGGEECDDGDPFGGDGCSADCSPED